MYLAIRDFIESRAKRIENVRRRFQMDRRPVEQLLPVEKQLERITVSQLVEFCDFSKEKYLRAKTEPGRIVLVIIHAAEKMYN